MCRRLKAKLSHEERLIRRVAQELINANNQLVEPVATDPAAPEQSIPQPRKGAPKWCSECGTIWNTKIHALNAMLVKFLYIIAVLGRR
jgi:hypothetical protein